MKPKKKERKKKKTSEVGILYIHVARISNLNLLLQRKSVYERKIERNKKVVKLIQQAILTTVSVYGNVVFALF